MIPQLPEGRGAVRLAVLDDNPFVRGPDGDVRPQAAVFHRFAAAVVAAGDLPAAAYLVPVRPQAAGEPTSTMAPIDGACLRVIPTTPFEGIAGYLRHGPTIARRNWPLIRDAIAHADLVWIKAPASNALLAALAAHRAAVPRFTWIAGSVRDVVAGSDATGARRAAGSAAAIAYDGATRWLERSGPAIRLGPDLFTSVVTDAEITTTRASEASSEASVTGATDAVLRVVWAGRMTSDKGVVDLLEAVHDLVAAGRQIRVTLIGDGPARPDIEARIGSLGLTDRVALAGYIGDRLDYMAALREADVFVLPSHAEGMPKVMVEAMAAGLPVIATAVGAVPTVLSAGRRGRLVAVGDPAGLAVAIAELADDPAEQARLREAGLAFAAQHTIESQARRLLDWMGRTFPDLRWGMS